MKRISLLCCFRIVVPLLKYSLFKTNANFNNKISFLNPNLFQMLICFMLWLTKKKQIYRFEEPNSVLLEYFKNSSVCQQQFPSAVIDNIVQSKVQ